MIDIHTAAAVAGVTVTTIRRFRLADVERARKSAQTARNAVLRTLCA